MPSRSEAFRRQARSDLDAYQSLALGGAADCHRLHYLQMATEKLGRALRTSAGQHGAEQYSHVAIAKALRLIRNQRAAAEALTRGNRGQLRSVIDKCIDLAVEIEGLAPAIASGENAEYPWLSIDGETWIAPCDHSFPLAARVRGPEGRRYLLLLIQLIDRFDQIMGD